MIISSLTWIYNVLNFSRNWQENLMYKKMKFIIGKKSSRLESSNSYSYVIKLSMKKKSFPLTI